MTNLSTVRVGYDRWAKVYDHDANPLQALEEPVVWRAIGDSYGKKVLDLGCGTGRHSLRLAAAGAMVVGVDFSEGMLEEARRKPGAERIQFVRHDLHEPLPFGNGEFDLVVSGLVLEHLRELEPFFTELKRVLKTNGHAVISAMHPAMFLRGSQARFTDPSSGELVQPGSIAHSISEFVMGATRARLRITNIEEVSPCGAFAAEYPRAAKYVDWPMLAVMKLAVGPGSD
jgi:ubiquinone/menaquinone biosynthesis C-methylase UbiE